MQIVNSVVLSESDTGTLTLKRQDGAGGKSTNKMQLRA